MTIITEYHPADPFDIGKFVLPHIYELVPEKDHNEFVSCAYECMLTNIYKGEFFSSLYYPELSKCFDAVASKEFFCNMAKEETEHTAIFLDIINKAYNKTPSIEEISIPKIDLSYSSLEKRIAMTYVIEIKTAALLSGFYTNSTNTHKRDLMAGILKDEGTHTLHLLSMFKNLVKNMSLNDKTILKNNLIEHLKTSRFVLYEFFCTKFSKDDLTYMYANSAWHAMYLNKSNKRLYRLIHLLDNDITYDNFVQQIDEFVL